MGRKPSCPKPSTKSMHKMIGRSAHLICSPKKLNQGHLLKPVQGVYYPYVNPPIGGASSPVVSPPLHPTQ